MKKIAQIPLLEMKFSNFDKVSFIESGRTIIWGECQLAGPQTLLDQVNSLFSNCFKRLDASVMFTGTTDKID